MPKKRNKQYWRDRMEALEDKQYQKSQKYILDVQKQYDDALRQLQKDTEVWYARLAENNDISYAKAKQLLKKSELEEFHWSVEQYIKAGRENAIDERWAKELENASARYHITRLEAIQMQMRQHMEVLKAEFDGSMGQFLSKSFEDNYYHMAYEMAKGTGICTTLSKWSPDKADIVIKTPWAQDGKNFSDRIWNNKEKLVRELHKELTQCIIRGESPDRAIKELAKTMNVSKKQAGTLIMTESAAIASIAQQRCFTDLAVEEFEVVETLDGHTCKLCGDMDGQHFSMSDFVVGVTAPPFHPRCRGCTCPYFNDEFTEGEKRAARNSETGKTEFVQDMTYKEWKNAFVDGDKLGLQEDVSDDIMKLKNNIADADVQIADLKKQFSDITEGYSYDDWFRDFKTVEDGYGVVTEADAPDVQKLKDISKNIKDIIQKKSGWKSQLPILGGQGTPLNITDALKGANPYYARGTQYSVNCQRCVQTYELRRRGYDVEALPKPKKKNTVVWGNECFVDSSGNTPQFTFNQSEKAIMQTLANAPDNSRHIIYTAWKGSRTAHVFIAEKQGGVVRFVDPQVNKDDVRDYFSRSKPNKFGILRVDDKDITTDDSILKATIRW